MRILQLAWENFGTEDMREAFLELGHEVTLLKTTQEELLTDVIVGKLTDAIAGKLKEAVGVEYDFVFGFNYFPQVATVCNTLGIPYCAWVYDNPCVQLYSCTVIYPTNHIYVFDSDTYLRFAGAGIETIQFLPMAANPTRLRGCSDGTYKHDISFVGSLYTESHNFYDRMKQKGLAPYTDGYIRGLMEAQKRIYGYNLLTDYLNDRVISDMHDALPLEPEADSVITHKELFADFVINRQITAEERMDMLTRLGKINVSARIMTNPNVVAPNIALYTRDPQVSIPGITNYRPVDFYKGAPEVFGTSRINLNISLRSIVNGIPLRCFEIMGSGGFLLTSYAGDYDNFFINGEDYVSFDSVDDMIAKCEYYLEHDQERREIAENGYRKVCESHTYINRAEIIVNNI